MNPKPLVAITSAENVLTMAEEDPVKATFNTRSRCKDVVDLAPRVSVSAYQHVSSCGSGWNRKLPVKGDCSGTGL